MNDIRFLIHVTEFRNTIDILESKFIYPQSKTGNLSLSIEQTDTAKIFTTLVTKNAPNMGLSWRNISGERKSVFLIDKSILRNKKFFINLHWYGYIIKETYKSSEHSLRSKEFKDLIRQIDTNFNENDMNQNETMFITPISVQKYVIGIYTIFGNIYQDVCNVDYLLLVNPLDDFLSSVENKRFHNFLASVHYSFHHRSLLIKKINPKIFHGVIELNSSCDDYNIIGQSKK